MVGKLTASLLMTQTRPKNICIRTSKDIKVLKYSGFYKYSYLKVLGVAKSKYDNKT